MKPAADIVIRPMRPADIPRVREIALSLPHAPRWAPDAYHGATDAQVLPRRIALVAETAESDAVLGFAVASLLPPQAELESIAVAAEAQRRGIAHWLFAVLTGELRSAQVTEVMLEVRASNGPALGFYDALGFTVAGRRPRYYADPEEDAVLLNLPLG
jgi:ribosomal-protein-alanine N-acetyltransferase